jgi:uroporphyrinogen decarboxylase
MKRRVHGGESMPEWVELPAPEPDFANLLAVLRRAVPARPTLFEFFLNDRLHERLAPLASLADGPYRVERQVLQAYHRAGYDHTNVRTPGFDFPTGHDFSARTVSLSGGGLIVDWPTYEAYRWPDPEAADYAIFDVLEAILPDGMKLIAYGPGGVLENVVEIVGFEKLCLLLTDEPDLIECVFEAVGESLVRYYEIAAQHPAVGACIDNDDWGFKTQTMLSPRQMRQYVFPWHKRIVEMCHRAGKPVILHSCGHFERILDDMTGIGIDARHSYEDTILPVEEAYERYHDRFGIIGGIDVDFICRSSPEEVYARSRAMLERTAGRGGYALGTGNSVPDYVPDENYFAMLHAALDLR